MKGEKRSWLHPYMSWACPHFLCASPRWKEFSSWRYKRSSRTKRNYNGLLHTSFLGRLAFKKTAQLCLKRPFLSQKEQIFVDLGLFSFPHRKKDLFRRPLNLEFSLFWRHLWRLLNMIYAVYDVKDMIRSAINASLHIIHGQKLPIAKELRKIYSCKKMTRTYGRGNGSHECFFQTTGRKFGTSLWGLKPKK